MTESTKRGESLPTSCVLPLAILAAGAAVSRERPESRHCLRGGHQQIHHPAHVCTLTNSAAIRAGAHCYGSYPARRTPPLTVYRTPDKLSLRTSRRPSVRAGRQTLCVGPLVLPPPPPEIGWRRNRRWTPCRPPVGSRPRPSDPVFPCWIPMKSPARLLASAIRGNRQSALETRFFRPGKYSDYVTARRLCSSRSVASTAAQPIKSSHARPWMRPVRSANSSSSHTANTGATSGLLS